MTKQVPQTPELTGSIVLYYDKGALLCAIVSSAEGQSLQLMRPDAGKLSLNSSRLMLISKSRFPVSTDSLAAFINAVQSADLPDFTIPAQGIRFEELTQVIGIREDIPRFALYFFLKQYPQKYFQKHQLFFERSEAEQTQYLQRLEIKRQREQFLSEFRSLANDPEHVLSPQVRTRLISELRRLLQGEKIEDLHKELCRQASDPLQLASELRCRLGDSVEIRDPALAASGLPISFLCDYPAPLDDPLKLPLASHTAFSIDDEDSLDFDDALSLQELDGGYLLGIHVSNLAFHLNAEDPLFACAGERVSSIYLPSGNIPMLPPDYSESFFSLLKDQERAVLSLYLSFDSALKLLSTRILAERIRISDNLSYDDVDREIAGNGFALLQAISRNLKELRDPESNGEHRRYIYNLKATKDEIGFRRINLQSPSRMMIEELMIFYNRSLANYGSQHGLPMLFRNIRQFAGDDDDTHTRSAYLDIRADYHPGIGAEAYLHASSPIRRVVDIINQMQIHHHLKKGSPCFDADSLQRMILDIEKRIHLIRNTMQKSERFWLLRLIQSKYLHKPLEAVLRSGERGKYRVEILPWGKQLTLKLDASPGGDYFNFVAYEVDWDKMLLKADLID